MSRFLLVELHADLEQLPEVPPKTTRSAVFRGIVQVPGVKSVSDVEYVDRESLNKWLMPLPLEEQLRSVAKAAAEHAKGKRAKATRA